MIPLVVFSGFDLKNSFEIHLIVNLKFYLYFFLLSIPGIYILITHAKDIQLTSWLNAIPSIFYYGFLIVSQYYLYFIHK